MGKQSIHPIYCQCFKLAQFIYIEVASEDVFDCIVDGDFLPAEIGKFIDSTVLACCCFN